MSDLLQRAWRGWAALCLAAGTVVLPLFWEVFSGGTFLRFLALPLRWFWALGPTRRVLQDGWLSRRRLAVAVGLIGGVLVAMTMVDLIGIRRAHPGWLLGLEWWQRPIYPWLALLPEFHIGGRPGYLWIAAVWTFLETVVWGVLLWRPLPRTVTDPAVEHDPGGIDVEAVRPERRTEDHG